MVKKVKKIVRTIMRGEDKVKQVKVEMHLYNPLVGRNTWQEVWVDKHTLDGTYARRHQDKNSRF